MNITGRITQKQSITGTVNVTADISGAVGDVVHISGTISRQTQRLTGTVKNLSHVHGIISKPSGHAQSDHQFVIVDLVKLQAQMLAVSNVTAIVPFTAESSQAFSTQFNINAVPAQVTVNSPTVNNTVFTATNITVNEEVYTNVNA